jgi:hypothetical protein
VNHLAPCFSTFARGPEVGFAEITADLLEARFWIVSGLLTINERSLIEG